MRSILSLILVLMIMGCEPIETDILVYERVIDGDTLVASGKRIRLWGIDAPEKNEPEAFSSTMYLKVLVENRELQCVFKHKDRYQRDVMQCFSDGYDIAADMVKMGMAKDYTRYSKGYYKFYEAEAKAKKIGIWSGAKI